MDLVPNPTYPLVCLGRIREAHWGAMHRSLDLLVAQKYKRRRLLKPVLLGARHSDVQEEWVDDFALFQTTLILKDLEPFKPFIGEDLTGMPIVLAGQPVGGVDSPDGHYLKIRNPTAFIPNQEWLEGFDPSDPEGY